MSTCEIDLAFQSRARWAYKQKQEFINSCMIDMNISKFVLVDVKRCYASADTKEDKKYFKYWLDKEVLHLIIDCNNRKLTLEEFTRDEIEIPVGDYVIAHKDVILEVRPDTDTFSTMDENLRGLFLSNRISIHTITKATRMELSDVFKRMNSGTPLNLFENLNCEYSTTCESIRNITDKMADDFLEANLFTQIQINRRVIDGWFAHVSYLYAKGINQSFGKPVHTNWYTTNSGSNDLIGKFVKDWTAYKELVDKKLVLFHHRWVYFDLFYQIQEQKRLNKNLVNKEDIVQDFIDMISPILDDKTPKYYYPDPKTKKFEFEEGKTVLYPFSELIKGEGGNTPTRFKAYKDAGWDITKYFGEPKDKKRVATRKEKQAIAVRDGWKDSDGDDFIPEELFDGEFDAGHIVAYDNAGQTTPDNMVIEKMKQNRGKGKETTQVV